MTMKEQKRVPKLRFEEFSEAWEIKTLGEIGGVSMCKRIMKDQTSDVGEIPFFKIGTFGKNPDAFIAKNLYESYKSKYSFPKKGDILISASGTIGRIVIYNGEPAYFQDSNIVWIDNNEQDVLNNLLVYLYENVNWNTENTTIARLYNNNLRSIEITFPSIPEQQKIASFLSSVDKKIAQLQQKKRLLEDYKKGVMQQIFSQELRFTRENGSAYPDWEERKMKDVAPLQRGFDLPTSKIIEGDYPVVYSNGILRKHNEFKVKAPGVITGRSGTIGQVTYINEKFWPHNTSLWVTDFKGNDPKFIYYLYQFFKLERFNAGSTVPTLNRNDVHAVKKHIPIRSEQTQIAHFLSAIDKKIAVVQAQIEHTQQFKKGLLQQMFV